MKNKNVRIKLGETGTGTADEPLGWGITPFKRAYYVRKKYLRTDGFRANYNSGLCFYKFLYVWMNYVQEGGTKIRALGWKYWLPNPLLSFIWFRVAIPKKPPGDNL